MKRKRIISILIISSGLLFIAASSSIQGTCDAPIVGGHTGAPGESSCLGCHAGTANTGPGTLQFDLGTTTYVPGQTYTGTVKIAQAGIDKFGFVALALETSGNTTIGSFNLLDIPRTRTYADGPRNYVSHTPCGADNLDSAKWQFTWQAPSTNVGNIKIYLAGLATNHNHATSGDNTYLQNFTLTPSNIGVEQFKENSELNVFPNPASKNISVNLSNKNKKISEIKIIDTQGKVVLMLNNLRAAERSNFDVSELSNGFYYLKVRSEETEYFKRIIIAN
jgi:hypothetical protein